MLKNNAREGLIEVVHINAKQIVRKRGNKVGLGMCIVIAGAIYRRETEVASVTYL